MILLIWSSNCSLRACKQSRQQQQQLTKEFFPFFISFPTLLSTANKNYFLLGNCGGERRTTATVLSLWLLLVALNDALLTFHLAAVEDRPDFSAESFQFPLWLMVPRVVVADKRYLGPLRTVSPANHRTPCRLVMWGSHTKSHRNCYH